MPQLDHARRPKTKDPYDSAAATAVLLARWIHFLAGIIRAGHNDANAITHRRWRQPVAADLTNPASPMMKEPIRVEHGFFGCASVAAWAAGMFMPW